MNKVIEFVMVDVYEMIQMIYIYIQNVINLVYFHNLTIYIKSVYKKTSTEIEEITNDYITGMKTEEDSLIYINWIFENKEYNMLYKASEPIEFPPHSFQAMKKRPKRKLISLFINGKEEPPSRAKYIIQFAGPLHDFYGRKPKLNWISKQFTDETEVVFLTSKGEMIEYENL